MKIVQVMDTLTILGGVNSFVYDLCRALARQGHEVTLIGILGKNKDEATIAVLRAEGITVHCLDATSKQNAILHARGKLRRLVESLSQGEKTVVNLHLKLSVLLGALSLGKLRHVVCLETYHSQYSRYTLQYWLCRRSIKKYICCSDSALEEFTARFRPRAGKAIAIANAVDKAMLRKLVGVTDAPGDGTVTFLSVGRFSYEKNFQVSVGAYAGVDLPGTQYVLIGNGPQEALLRQKANECACVVFRGAVSRAEVLAELCRAAMVVMPSLWEGRSILMLESIAMGCPLMLSNEPAFRDVVHEPPLGEAEGWRVCSWGYLVDTSDEEAYRAAMRDYVNHPEREAPFREAIERLSEVYDIAFAAKKYVEVYAETCE